jgi:hypothetical protein
MDMDVEEKTLTISLWRRIIFLPVYCFICVCFGFGGYNVAQEGSPFGWVILAVAIFVGLFGLYFLTISPGTLKLTKEGFRIRNFWKNAAYSWHDFQDFKVSAPWYARFNYSMATIVGIYSKQYLAAHKTKKGYVILPLRAFGDLDDTTHELKRWLARYGR